MAPTHDDGKGRIMAEATYPGQGAAIAFESPVLRCAGLTKTFGAATALDNVSFSVPRGRVVGLLGPNGSGKTTLIKLAAGLLTPTAGQVLVAGSEPGPQTKALVSYLPERPYFSPSIKVAPVSYTHLLGGAYEFDWETIPPIASGLTISLVIIFFFIPVSYTHLDVYKRQGQYLHCGVE